MDIEASFALDAILRELKQINNKLDSIESNTSVTEHNFAMLESKLDEMIQVLAKN
ncbi:hypothetical protein [Paenisporosarcina sp. TG20]|uniref:hypothetical protein n=1 Tax=Paenisporosarcina sp. TG20 TaxID=1211706 RepID=UPI0002F408FD|nr:hypothetical protein [Paenisporosarcina sp. TG20]